MIQHMVITGATSGIGEAIAKAAARGGYGLSITGIEVEHDVADLLHELKELGAPFTHYRTVDLTKAEAARHLIEDLQSLQPLDVLVNNAGIQHVAPVEDFSQEAWDRVIAVNLSAAFHTISVAMPFMKARNYGRIINIASVHGLVASVNKAAYVAAKHGIIGLTKTVALETAELNITCNAICPGWVRTPLVEAQVIARAEAAGRDIEEEARLLVSEKQPSGAFVLPEQIGQMALYLASDAASMITGSSFTMDGGWTAQ